MNIYVAATRQNDGKTVTALGLVLALQKRVPRVGFIKPVGQQYLMVNGDRVDKDAVLIHDAARLDSHLPDLSPVAVPRGFTERYIDDPEKAPLVDRIFAAYEAASRGADVTVIEGTGHAGVGSVFDLSNAEVAHLLCAPALIVCSGGIGRPIDDVMLNRALFDCKGVPVAGVVVNKVKTAKYDKINAYVRKGLDRLGVPVWGVMPYEPSLAHPSIEEVATALKAETLSGVDHLKTPVTNFVIGAMRAHEALDWFDPDSLLITPGNREDLILAALSLRAAGRQFGMAGIVLTCGIEPHPSVLELIRQTDFPVVVTQEDTFTTASRMHDLIVKVRAVDTVKIAEIERLTEEHLDVDGLLNWLEGHPGCL